MRTLSLASVGACVVDVRAALARGQTVVAVLPVDDVLDIAPLLLRLSAAERERSARFLFRKDRVLYVAARRLLAVLVNMALGPDGPAWRLTAPRDGSKPRLTVEGEARWFVNLSHTEGFAAVGLSRTSELGVDVEAVRPLGNLVELAAATMTAREQAAITAGSPPEAAFFRLWTRKEALLKAYGVGLSTPLAALDVLDPKSLRMPDKLRGPVTLVDVELGGGAVGSICMLEPRGSIALTVFRTEHLFDRAHNQAGRISSC